MPGMSGRGTLPPPEGPSWGGAGCWPAAAAAAAARSAAAVPFFFFGLSPFGDGGRNMATPPAQESCLVPGKGSSAMSARAKYLEMGCCRSLLSLLLACCTSIAASCIGDRASTSVRSATMFSFTSLLPARVNMTRIRSLPNSMLAASSTAMASVMSGSPCSAGICSAVRSNCRSTPTGGKLLRMTACFGFGCSPCGPCGPAPGAPAAGAPPPFGSCPGIPTPGGGTLPFTPAARVRAPRSSKGPISTVNCTLFGSSPFRGGVLTLLAPADSAA
mmetsp:Transcript_9806/g.23315  ORF Transcript_9806/g.23315 Transcript_9806/m.23315 type:complete len:273 (+) Transcript_9806:1575-2393(+)